ncbi:hypothetical protein BpHYR1_046994 [Brachionus plicatilis]|uniref:RNA-directed DNA polymerase from mobile element jockey-like n=1 Tax=Brachionus plicatilis TaxID=10195 RepID=A0A3M7SDS3_BRAPC|nr:hypothetical protein BpHYR1_046994 [Brachionus plicatilis]
MPALKCCTIFKTKTLRKTYINELNKLVKWAAEWRTVLNFDKCKVIRIAENKKNDQVESYKRVTQYLGLCSHGQNELINLTTLTLPYGRIGQA